MARYDAVAATVAVAMAATILCVLRLGPLKQDRGIVLLSSNRVDLAPPTGYSFGGDLPPDSWPLDHFDGKNFVEPVDDRSNPGDYWLAAGNRLEQHVG